MYEYELFKPAAVYETPEGEFVMGHLRAREWSPAFVAEAAVCLAASFFCVTIGGKRGRSKARW